MEYHLGRRPLPQSELSLAIQAAGFEPPWIGSWSVPCDPIPLEDLAEPGPGYLAAAVFVEHAAAIADSGEIPDLDSEGQLGRNLLPLDEELSHLTWLIEPLIAAADRLLWEGNSAVMDVIGELEGVGQALLDHQAVDLSLVPDLPEQLSELATALDPEAARGLLTWMLNATVALACAKTNGRRALACWGQGPECWRVLECARPLDVDRWLLTATTHGTPGWIHSPALVPYLPASPDGWMSAKDLNAVLGLLLDGAGSVGRVELRVESSRILALPDRTDPVPSERWSGRAIAKLSVPRHSSVILACPGPGDVYTTGFIVTPLGSAQIELNCDEGTVALAKGLACEREQVELFELALGNALSHCWAFPALRTH